MSSYSFSLTTFNPSGKLLQIEYALNAVGQGGASLAVKGTNGVVLCSERKMPTPLIVAEDVHKIHALDTHVGCAYSGIGPDARVLVTKARKTCQEYRLTYGEGIPVKQLVREIAAVMQEYTQSGGVRPFGVSLLVSGWDSLGPQLYQVDPSGSYFAWKATAIGRNATMTKTYLEKRYSPTLEREDAIHTALLTLKEGFDGKMTPENTELGVVFPDGTFKVLDARDVADYLDEVQ
eukprot:PhM_4_TR17196/c0_g1_i1/m.60083/K02726/PSMA2; 20S proteasome subunit alpha 2